jgi:hypothetical protein
MVGITCVAATPARTSSTREADFALGESDRSCDPSTAFRLRRKQSVAYRQAS